jgi:tetratricopeptide (TPR) repeat protein
MAWKICRPVIPLLLTALLAVAQTASPPRSPAQDNTPNFEGRIAQALRAEVPDVRDRDLIKIAFDQGKAGRLADAKATIWNYVEDKDGGFAYLMSGLIEDGRYEDARSILELIVNFERRAIGFKEIAAAQAKSGDLAAARQTLLAGLDDALREENVPNKRFTMHHIVEGMAAAGLTEDVRNTLKLFDASDLRGGYVVAAIIFAQRGDLDEARWGFLHAVELARQDSEWADDHLVQIAEAQADVGLFKDAKRTAAMIHNKSQKASARLYISYAKKR